MSLTSILDYSNKEFKEFRCLLRDSFPAPKSDLGRPIEVPPITKNPRLIGKAFDYLIRFHLKRKFGPRVYERPWVAETALRYFDDRDNGIVYGMRGDLETLSDDELLKGFDGKEERDRLRNIYVKERFSECLEVYNQFLHLKLQNDTELIKSSLFLGQLDAVVREGKRARDHIDLLPENENDISDLRSLIENCDLNLFNPGHKLILNPTFGAGSKLVGGADADLIIDDTLIDIKVTKEMNLGRPNYNQLIGYYLLFLIGGIDGHEEIVIRKLGFYFARHKILWTIQVNEVGDSEKFKSAIGYLKRHVKQSRLRRKA